MKQRGAERPIVYATFVWGRLSVSGDLMRIHDIEQYDNIPLSELQLDHGRKTMDSSLHARISEC